jgi:LysM repeat protein
MAQTFTTHAVKQGETLYSISKKYGIPKESILKYNKEIKVDGSLPVNTILVIPGAKKDDVSLDGDEGAKEEVTSLINAIIKDSVPERVPIGFVEHKVKKKETIFSITKKYNISEEELKRYNKQLYAAQLRKKMELRIPKYRAKEKTGSTVDPSDYEKYIVAPKETRWSIAHKYGITIDSMLVLNPSLSKTTNYLAEGYELLLPKRPGSSVENQQTQIYTSYTIPAKMNFYRLEKEFGVSSDEVIRLNPEIVERGGLKEGMVIRIPEKKRDPGAINTENYIFYEVKPKQNEFRLTRKFGMPWQDLVTLNPELKDGLKAGMILKLPKDQIGDFEVKNSLILDRINLLDSIDVANRPRLLYMLPFRLDKLNMADKEQVAEIILRRNSLKYSLGLYSGAMVALDSIKDLGVSVTVKTVDNQLELERTKQVLQVEDLSKYNAIFGPLDVASLKEVSVQAAQFNVPVIAPVPAKSDISLSNVFFSYTEDEDLRNHMLQYVAELRTNENILVIADSERKAVADSIVAKFPGAKIVAVRQEEKNIGVNRDKLASLLVKDAENWVFLETENFQLISSVVSILNAFNNTALNPEEDKEVIKLRMFTTDRNNGFENDAISSTHLSNLNFTYPSVYREVGANAFVKRYKTKFGENPDRYAVRGFDLTMDLLLKLAYKNDLIDISKFIGSTEYNGSQFNYEKDPSSGYFNKASYIMAYEDMHIKQLE